MIGIPGCLNCGEITPEGKFCEHCGTPLHGPRTQVSPPAYPQPVTPPAPAQVRKGRSGITIVLMLASILFLIVIILAIIGFISETAQEPDTTACYTPSSTPVWHDNPVETVQIQGGFYRYYFFNLNQGNRKKIAISTSGPAIDLMITDAENFKKYENSFTDGGSWDAWNSLKIIKTDYIFTAPADGTYYGILDNTPLPTSGVHAEKDVRVQATFSIYY